MACTRMHACCRLTWKGLPAHLQADGAADASNDSRRLITGDPRLSIPRVPCTPDQALCMRCRLCLHRQNEWFKAKDQRRTCSDNIILTMLLSVRFCAFLISSPAGMQRLCCKQANVFGSNGVEVPTQLQPISHHSRLRIPGITESQHIKD